MFKFTPKSARWITMVEEPDFFGWSTETGLILSKIIDLIQFTSGPLEPVSMKKLKQENLLLFFYRYDDLNKNFEVNIFSNNMVESSRTTARSCWNRVHYWSCYTKTKTWPISNKVIIINKTTNKYQFIQI